MRNTLLAFLLLAAAAQADTYIYNLTDESLKYQLTQPNGDTRDGEVKAFSGYAPGQTSIPTPDDKLAPIKLTSESGATSISIKAPPRRNYLLGKKDGKLFFRPISWNVDDGQKHKRQITFYNATDSAQTFDLIDQKEMRSLTLAPGEEKTVDAKNGINGSSHNLKYADGHRQDAAASTGMYVVLYTETANHNIVTSKPYGYITSPAHLLVK